MASRQHDVEMFQKGRMQSLFIETATSQPLSEASEMDDTEFEEDMSDFDDYAGRRSEESVRGAKPRRLDARLTLGS